MRESSTYQAILDEGRQEGMQRMLLEQGQRKFGPPNETVITVLTAITDVERLTRMGARLLTVASWEELLATS